MFQIFHKIILTQFVTEIIILRSDNGKEYNDSSFNPYLASNVNIHQISYVDTPQQNGVVERKNRHLLDIATFMLFSTNVPKIYWGHAILTAYYFINRLHAHVLGKKSPLKVLSTSSSLFSISRRVFGCTYFVRDHN